MAAHIGIVLPGRAYGPHGPALHLPRLVLQQLGAEVSTVSYHLDTEERYDVLPPSFHESVAEQVAALVEKAQPERVTFVAKSLGTIALAALDGSVSLPANVDAVWINPMFELEPVRAGLVAKGWPSLFIAGEADPSYIPEHHDAVRESIGADALVIPGADHSIEIEGDVLATIEAFRIVTDRCIAFLTR